MDNFRPKIKLTEKAFVTLQDDMICFSNARDLNIKSFCKKIIKNFLEDNPYLLDRFMSLYNGSSVELTSDSNDEIVKFINDSSSDLVNSLLNLDGINRNEYLDFEVLSESCIIIQNLEEDNLFNIPEHSLDKIDSIELRNIIKKIHKSKSMYIKYILEYYSRQNQAERERIYFFQQYTKIKNHIANKTMISITTKLSFLPHSYNVVPIDIRLNDTHTHYYLISKVISVNKRKVDNYVYVPKLNDYKLFTVRISEINQVSTTGTSSYKVDDLELKLFNDLLIKYHIAYVTYKSKEIKVKFDSSTLKRFHTSSYQRPSFDISKDEEGNTIYILECPILQAVAYFIGFKGDFTLFDDELTVELIKYHNSQLNYLK